MNKTYMALCIRGTVNSNSLTGGKTYKIFLFKPGDSAIMHDEYYYVEEDNDGISRYWLRDRFKIMENYKSSPYEAVILKSLEIRKKRQAMGYKW